MKRILAAFFALVFSAQASAPPRGADRLRELVVFPEMKLNFSLGWKFEGNHWFINDAANLPAEARRLRAEVQRRPDDAGSILRLGFFLDDQANTNEAQSCFHQAEQLCRNKAAAAPQDGLNFTALGEALEGLGRDEAAESAFRQATVISPAEWRCWVGLGNFLTSASANSLFPFDLRMGAYGFLQEPAPAVLNYRPAPGALEKSQSQSREAARCFDRARALAPRDPEMYFQFAGFLSKCARQDLFFRHYRNGEKIEMNAWELSCFPEESVASLEKAAELTPKDVGCTSLTAVFEAYRALAQSHSPNADPAQWPEAAQKWIRDALTRLGNLSEDKDPALAASAAENRGLLSITLGNFPAASVDFRRAVNLDPAREQAWDMLLGSLVQSATPAEIKDLCAERLRHNASARNHLLLAHALDREKNWAGAAGEASAALQLEPDNATAHLELAALALKQSAAPGFLPPAVAELTRAAEAFKSLANQTELPGRRREVMLDGAILNGLLDTPEGKAAAKSGLSALLQQNPNDRQAAEILSALN